MATRAFPEGWFRVAPAGALPREAVHTVRAFGRELVLFRTAAGAVAAVDPHCPHMGAHLGHGGSVDGELLRCPFHGLKYDVAGRCAAIRGALATWPIEEWHGQLMVFASADRRLPDWPLPILSTEGWSAPHWRTLRLEGHVQDVAENGVDLDHFVAVHGYSNVRDPLLEVNGFTLHTRFGFDRANPVWAPLGKVSAIFDTDIHGLGCSITDLRVEPLGLHFRLLLLATQIDERQLDFSIGISAERPALARGRAGEALWRGATAALMRFMMKTIVGDVLQDQEIWAHRAWLERPALTASDAPLATFRRYAQRFYPAPGD
jgi:phenylpropionate dioxygenase-like ring-hydroxylating dioxygenase large terminal subunit